MICYNSYVTRSGNMEKNLYQWQEDCLKKWFSNRGRGIVQAVTGSGKTLLALTAADRLEQMAEAELRVRIVVPTATLMWQWHHTLRDFCDKKYARQDVGRESGKLIGLRGAGYRDASNCRYMIYVINSARYELARQILSELREGKAVLLIADECHHYISGQNSLIFEFLPHIQPYEDHFYSLGLSATLPTGQAGKELAAALGRRIYDYGVEAAAEQQTVCPYDIFHIGISFQEEEREEYEELSDRLAALYGMLVSGYPIFRSLDQRSRFEMLQGLVGNSNRKIADAARQYMNLSYKRKGLVCMASQRLDCACSLVQYLGIRDKILIFGERIQQADALYGLLQKYYPGRVGRYHSKLGAQANKNALERFRSGDIRILIACKAIDEGVDVPDASIGIILSGTSARRQRVQRLGRIIRKKEGKDRASLYYLHVAESSEDVCFLPDVKGSRTIELDYLAEERLFHNACYGQKTAWLLEQMRTAGQPEEKTEEVRHCLTLGSVRADWMADEAVIERQFQNAESVRERNYWKCMKKLSEWKCI